MIRLMSSQFTESEEIAIFEAARLALSDSEIFDSIADKMDLHDAEMSRLVEKLQTWMTDNDI